MKLSIPFFLLFLMALTAAAQNKTLGIGVATPNPNAALHVEAPTANQGFIMPRLTTAQRTATSFVSALAATDNGLLVYDTDLKNIYLWNGTAWVSCAKPIFPFGESVNNTAPNTSLFALTNTGTATGNFGVAYFENTNPNSGFTPLYVKTNSLTNGATEFIVDNPLNNNDGIAVSYNGIGTAGRFTVNNPDAVAAVYGSTNSNTGVAVYGATTGTGAAIQGINTGAGNGFAGYFSNTNAGNTYPAIQVWTLGTGPGLRVLQGGGSKGGGVDVQLHDPANGSVGASVLQKGTANAGNFYIDNAGSGAPSVQVSTNGTGHGIFTETSNINNGTASALYAQSNSLTAYAANVRNTNTGTSGGALYAVTYGSGGTTATFNHRGSGGNIIDYQSSDARVAMIDKTGKGFFNGGTQTGGADVAELFDVTGDRNSYEPGDVLVISESEDRTVEKSNSPASTRVAGVYATKPGVVLTEKGLDENTDHLVPMGVIGVIPTKVCNENGMIKRGDLLVTASRPGYAMKAIPVSINGVLIYPTGAILGKALGTLDAEAGIINVLVNVK